MVSKPLFTESVFTESPVGLKKLVEGKKEES